MLNWKGLKRRINGLGGLELVRGHWMELLGTHHIPQILYSYFSSPHFLIVFPNNRSYLAQKGGIICTYSFVLCEVVEVRNYVHPDIVCGERKIRIK